MGTATLKYTIVDEAPCQLNENTRMSFDAGRLTRLYIPIAIYEDAIGGSGNHVRVLEMSKIKLHTSVKPGNQKNMVYAFQ